MCFFLENLWKLQLQKILDPGKLIKFLYFTQCKFIHCFNDKNIFVKKSASGGGLKIRLFTFTYFMGECYLFTSEIQDLYNIKYKGICGNY